MGLSRKDEKVKMLVLDECIVPEHPEIPGGT